MSKNNSFSVTTASRYSLALYELAKEDNSIDDIENVKVQASKVSGQKCQRCWKYEKELVKNEICNRCNDAIS